MLKQKSSDTPQMTICSRVSNIMHRGCNRAQYAFCLRFGGSKAAVSESVWPELQHRSGLCDTRQVIIGALVGRHPGTHVHVEGLALYCAIPG